MSRQLNFRDNYFSQDFGLKHRLPKPSNITSKRVDLRPALFFPQKSLDELQARLN